MPPSRGSSLPKDRTQVSFIAGRFFTVCATREAPQYWSGQPIPSPKELPDPGIKPGSPALQADSLPTELPGKPPLFSIQIQKLCILNKKTLELKNLMAVYDIQQKCFPCLTRRSLLSKPLTGSVILQIQVQYINMRDKQTYFFLECSYLNNTHLSMSLRDH